MLRSINYIAHIFTCNLMQIDDLCTRITKHVEKYTFSEAKYYSVVFSNKKTSESQTRIRWL